MSNIYQAHKKIFEKWGGKGTSKHGKELQEVHPSSRRLGEWPESLVGLKRMKDQLWGLTKILLTAISSHIDLTF